MQEQHRGGLLDKGTGWLSLLSSPTPFSGDVLTRTLPVNPALVTPCESCVPVHGANEMPCPSGLPVEVQNEAYLDQ